MTADTTTEGTTAATDTTAATTTAAATATETATTTTATPPEGQATETGDTGTTEGEGESAEAEGAPESYTEFAMPEGVELDTVAVEKLAPVFKEAGLSQKAAQSLVTAYAEHVKSQREAAAEGAEAWYAERREVERAQQIEADIVALKADPEIGGQAFEAVNRRVSAAIGAVATPAFRQFVDKHGVGNHPEFVRIVHALIDYVPQDQGERAAGAGGAEATPRSVLWGGSNN